LDHKEGMKSGSNHSTVTLAEYETLAEFRYALRQFFQFSENAATILGLTPRQHQALLAIKGASAKKSHLTIGGLAERLQIQHHSAVGLVNRLIQQQFLTRHISKSDRRQVELHLTIRGSRILEKLSGAHRDELRRIGPQINRLLRKIQK
jgi:DNA-binding MarR family transcriptional regulator